jgi:hypothetical protein
MANQYFTGPNKKGWRRILRLAYPQKGKREEPNDQEK